LHFTHQFNHHGILILAGYDFFQMIYAMISALLWHKCQHIANIISFAVLFVADHLSEVRNYSVNIETILWGRSACLTLKSKTHDSSWPRLCIKGQLQSSPAMPILIRVWQAIGKSEIWELLGAFFTS
jgi:hypothetical protein